MTNADILRYALRSLSQIYVSMYVLDLENDEYIPVKTTPAIEKAATMTGSLQDKLNSVMTHITITEHIPMVADFIDLSTLEKRMEGRNVISLVFEGKVSGWCKIRFIKIDVEEKELLHNVLCTVECIDEERRREIRLLHLARTDLMTGIFNRGHGEETIDTLIRAKTPGMFCLLDIDKFKQINDKYGHALGDKAIIAMADILREIQRPEDVVMRLGGDEFAAYFVGVQTASEAELIIDRLLTAVSNLVLEPMTEEVSVSLGAVICDESVEGFCEAYRTADTCMYDSKIRKSSTFVLDAKQAGEE